MPNKSALGGLRVIECGEMVAASYAAKLMADLGAEVIKVEPPSGDRSRGRGPFPKGMDWVVAILEEAPVPILDRNPSIPKRLAKVIDHALTEEPRIPFQTAAEFRKALKDAL